MVVSAGVTSSDVGVGAGAGGCGSRARTCARAARADSTALRAGPCASESSAAAARSASRVDLAWLRVTVASASDCSYGSRGIARLRSSSEDAAVKREFVLTTSTFASTSAFSAFSRAAVASSCAALASSNWPVRRSSSAEAAAASSAASVERCSSAMYCWVKDSIASVWSTGSTDGSRPASVYSDLSKPSRMKSPYSGSSPGLNSGLCRGSARMRSVAPAGR